MEQNKKKGFMNILLAIPFVLLAIGQLVAMGRTVINFFQFAFQGIPFAMILRNVFSLTGFGSAILIDSILMLAYVWIALCMILKKRDILMLLGPAVLLVVNFVNFVVGFLGNSYSTYQILNGGFKFNLLLVFPALVGLLVPLTMAALVAVYVFKGMDKVQGIVKKLWFIPAIAVFLSDITLWLVTIICLIARWRWFGGILVYGNLNVSSILSALGHIIGFVVLLAATVTLGIYICQPFQKKSKEVTEEVLVEETVEE